jgi:hypothetical protein
VRFRNRVHGRGNDWDIQPDLTRQAGPGIGIGGVYIA